jgi:transposase InsO family protein
MCQVLKVTRSGFYAWLRRSASRRSLENARLDLEVRALFNEHKGRAGSPKITRELQKRGGCYSRKRVVRSMKRQGLRSKVKRKYRVTTNSKHQYPVAPNLLNRKFQVSAPNQVWVGDIPAELIFGPAPDGCISQLW